MSDDSIKHHETFELDGVGEFRAKKGTSTAELAGAACFWNRRALAAEKALNKTQWNYFWAGTIFASICALGAVVIKGFL